MKRLVKKYALATTLLMGLSACQGPVEQESVLTSNGHAVGSVRGIAAIDSQIRNRLLDTDELSSYSFEIAKLAGFQIYGMKSLLGEFVSSGSHSNFSGAEPNPFGMLLWHQVLSRFSEGVAAYCDDTAQPDLLFFDGTKARLNGKAQELFTAACEWPEGEGVRETLTADLWKGVVGYSGAADRRAFVEFFTAADSPFAAASGKERVQAMVLAMVLNPHFLLEK